MNFYRDIDVKKNLNLFCHWENRFWKYFWISKWDFLINHKGIPLWLTLKDKHADLPKWGGKCTFAAPPSENTFWGIVINRNFIWFRIEKKYNFCKDDFEMLGGEFHGVFIPMNEPRCNNTNNEQINVRFGTIFELYPPLGPGKSFPSSATSFLTLKTPVTDRRRYNLMRCLRP